MPRRNRLKLDRKIEAAARQDREDHYRCLEIDLHRLRREAQESGVYPIDTRLFQPVLVGEPTEAARH